MIIHVLLLIIMVELLLLNCSYNDVEDEHRATNLLITADEAFVDIKVSTLGVSWSLSLSLSLSPPSLFSLINPYLLYLIQPLNRFRGFSSFKFLPGSQDSIIIALKSEENKGTIATCMLSHNILPLSVTIGNYCQ